MERIIGLDVGDLRVGVALAELPSGVIVPHATYARSKGTAEKAILALIAQHNIKTVVAGLPLTRDGARTPQCKSVEAFCRRLVKRSSIEVQFTDEHGTSYAAEERLNHLSQTKKARETGMIDALAASIILEDFVRSKTGA